MLREAIAAKEETKDDTSEAEEQPAEARGNPGEHAGEDESLVQVCEEPAGGVRSAGGKSEVGIQNAESGAGNRALHFLLLLSVPLVEVSLLFSIPFHKEVLSSTVFAQMTASFMLRGVLSSARVTAIACASCLESAASVAEGAEVSGGSRG